MIDPQLIAWEAVPKEDVDDLLSLLRETWPNYHVYAQKNLFSELYDLAFEKKKRAD